MAEACNVAPIAGKAALKLISIRIRYSLCHGKGQAGACKDMSTVDGANEWIDETENVGSILCVGREDSESQYRKERSKNDV